MWERLEPLQTLEEALSLKRLNQAELEASKGKLTNTNYVRHAGFEKNKQGELAYLDSRLNKITDMRMQFGAVLPDHVRNNVCQPEIAFFNGFNRTLARYQRAMKIDLESHMTSPQSLHVEDLRCG